MTQTLLHIYDGRVWNRRSENIAETALATGKIPQRNVWKSIVYSGKR